MKKLLIYSIGHILYSSVVAQDLPVMSYDIDVTQSTDTFYVSLSLDSELSKEANIYQFAATAPGTYQTMNIGRFVSGFKAFDAKGKEITVSKISVNQFELEKPHKVASITYQVAETFDTKVEEFPIYLMCGSSIEEDHSLINTHAIMGYFKGYQESPMKIKVKGNEVWKVGTALSKSEDYYLADNFDHAVDSPILMGNLSFADTTIADTKVEIFTYSKNDKVGSKALLSNMSDMLDATRRYLVKLPVDRYTFLYFFEPNPPGRTGAWEHSYSSEYVLSEKEPTKKFMESVTDIASHEFFHIVTPLNIHSEIVESFNFVTPTTSNHLWLYEGVTEWASNNILYRGGVITEENYLKNSLAYKVLLSEHYFDPSWSLKRLAEESFNGGEGAKQYGNVYYKGSLVAGYLDIRLLELSGGKKGLRELLLELIEKYGKGNPVSEATFINDIVAMTHPEIREFFDAYVMAAEPLPHEAYLSKIGMSFENAGNGKIKITKMEEMTESQKRLYEAWSKAL